MSIRRLSLLPFLILLLYAGCLLAVIENREELAQNLLFKALEEHGNAVQFENIPTIIADELASNAVNDLFSNLASALPVAFDPPELDFGQQPLGMPYLHEVTVRNPTNSLSLQLVSIVGTATEFHTSFFVSKVLRPGETTTFEVVFLASDTREIEDTLMIHSSLGSFEYKVRGEGMENPFRLRPLKGARIPINATYSPSITLYNPYSDPLQILEVYSSGKELKLELPTGSQEANKTVWEIRPYETKSIAKAMFYGRGMVKNHTAFIRIRTNHETTPSLVVPVEVEVCEATGLFASREVLDFGLIKSGAESKLPLYVLNAGPHQVDVVSITPTPENPSLKIELLNGTLRPATKYSKMANLVLAADFVEESGYQTGLLKIWAEDRSSFHQLSVPYEALVMKGSLEYNHSQTLFRVSEPPFSPIIRNITLQNNYHLPMVIYTAKLSSKAQELFTAEAFKSPYILPPDGEWHRVLVLRFQAQTSDCLFNTTLRLSTNMSFYNIPLQCYDGRLNYDFGGPDVDALEFGLLSDHDVARRQIKIYNPNPVRVSVSSMGVQEGSNIPGTSIRIVSMPFQDDTHVVGYYPDGLRKGRRPPYNLNPGTEIIFEVNVTRPRNPGKYSGELLIHTSFGKIVTVPVNYQAVQGGVSIVPSKLRFPSSFPYSTSVISLRVKSTYTRPIKLESLLLTGNSTNTTTNSSWPIILPDELPMLQPSTTTVVGNVVFNPLLLGSHALYTCSDIDFVSNFSDEPGFLEGALDKMVTYWRKWQALIQKRLKSFQLSLALNTEIDSVVVPVQGSLMWPKLATVSAVKFPLTMIGNSSTSVLKLYNPSDRPVHIKPLFITDYPNSNSVLSTLGDVFSLDVPLYNHTSKAFSIITNTNISYTQDPSDESDSLFIQPRMNQTLHLSFAPLADLWTHGLLFLVNNLTFLEYVPLMGVGSRGFVTVDGLHPNDSAPLVFEFTPTLMEECTRGLECSSVPEPLVITKTLRIYNSGPTPLQLLHTSINGNSCHGYGFSIANCEKKYILYPNKTRKIDVSFSPDYTLSRITSTLRLYVGDDFLDFPLLATLPHHMLTMCYTATPISESEALAAYLSVPLWVVALIVMIVATIFQVNWHVGRINKTFHAGCRKDAAVQPTNLPVFDLNNITRQVSSTITENVAELERRSTKPVEDTPTPAPDNTRHTKPLPSQPSKPNEKQETQEVKQKPPSTKQSSTSINTSTDSHTGTHVEPTIPKNVPTQNKDTPTPIKETPTKSTRLSESNGVKSQTPGDATPSDITNSPTKRKSKRVLQVIKSDKSTEPMATPTKVEAVVPMQPESLVSGAFNVLKQASFLRKESDESIPSVESDNSEHSSDPPPSLPDPAAGEVEPAKVKVVTTYTKEPGTGQTVPVKEEEGGAKDENGASDATPVTSVATNVSGKQPRSKKKQKAQQRREEKQRRKREKEELAIARRQQELHDSIDKESIASNSTVSTENYDDDHDHGLVSVTTMPKGESKDESPENVEQLTPESEVDTVTESVSIVIPAQEKEDATLSSSEPSPTGSQSSCSEDLLDTPPTDDTNDGDSLQESVKLAEDTDTQDPPLTTPSMVPPPSMDKENDRAQNKPVQTKSSRKLRDSDNLQERPKGTTKHSSVCEKQPKPEDSPPTTSTKPRPVKLTMKAERPVPVKEESPQADDELMDGEKLERPTNPHALAASLLTKEDIILRREKKAGSRKDDATSVSSNPPPPGKGNKKAEPAPNKRGLSLDAQAQPFYPPHPQYHYAHPIMAQHRKPLLTGHAHRMPSPPYGYFTEDMHHGHPSEQYYTRRRKRSEPTKSSVNPTMPYPYNMEGGASYERPHPLQPHVYDPEWMAAYSSGYVDSPEYHREYMGHHHAHSPPFESPHPSYMGSRSGHAYQEGIDWAAQSQEEEAYKRHLMKLRQRQIELRMMAIRERESLQELQSDSILLEQDIMNLRQQRKELMHQRATKESGHTHVLEPTQHLLSPTLNRAPGEHPTRATPPGLSSLLGSSGGGSRWPMGSNDSSSDNLSSQDLSSKLDVSSTWKALWSMDSPLSTALDEQRLIAAASLSAPSPPPLPSVPEENTSNVASLGRNTYNLFDNSSSSDIWGTMSPEGNTSRLFSLISSDPKSDEKDA